MEIDSLKAFISVATHGSFSLAAQQLFITQPAVSKRIAALEEELNHTLFNRLGKHVDLTEAGQQLLPKANKILKHVEDTARSIKELSGEITGILRVATSHHVGLHHLPPVLREFAAKHQNVNLQFEFLDSEKAYDRVLKGDCELAVVTLAPQSDFPLKEEVLWQDPLVFVTGKNHPLSSKKAITLASLSNEPAILPDLNTFTGRLAKSCFDEQGLDLKLNMATNYLETIKMMVSVGLGWSLLPKTLVDDQLTILHVPNFNMSRKLGVITHKKRSLSNAAVAFYALLKAKHLPI